MLRCLLAACLTLVATTGTKTQTILVPQPPTYHNGETYQGLVVSASGTLLELRQFAFEGPDRQVYIARGVVGPVGNLLGMIVVDPRTLRQDFVSGSHVVKMLDSTCSPKGLYPITEGKVYECSSTLVVNGRIRHAHRTQTFDQVERSKAGKVEGFCDLDEDTDGKEAIRTRICWSPDGKWIRSMQTLSAARLDGV